VFLLFVAFDSLGIVLAKFKYFLSKFLSISHFGEVLGGLKRQNWLSRPSKLAKPIQPLPANH
jgi:hypothetical protein